MTMDKFIQTYRVQLSLAVAALAFMPATAFACGIPDIVVEKSGPATIKPGETIMYTLTVRENNVNGGSTTNGKLKDIFPVGLVFNAAKTSTQAISHAGLNHVGQTGIACVRVDGPNHPRVDCILPNLGVNDATHVGPAHITWNIAFDVQSNVACGSTLSNFGKFTSNEINGIHSNTVTTRVECPAVTPTPTPTPSASPTPTPEQDKDIEVSKTDNKTITRPTHSLDYVITVKNTGDIDLHDVKVTDTVPGQLENIRNTTGSVNGRTITWTGVELDAGESKKFTFTATVKATAPNGHLLENKVVAKSEDHDLSDEATDTTIVERIPQVAAVITPVTPVPVTARTGAGASAALMTLIGAAGMAYTYRRAF